MKNWQLHLLMLLPLLYIILFKYVPMYGAQIAFRNFVAIRGIWGSEWVGMANFMKFFRSYQFYVIVRNTVALSVYSIVVGFPAPILLALALNYARWRFLRKTVQMVTYAPYFISTVVMVGIILRVLSPHHGIVNLLIQSLGFQSVRFMSNPAYFRSVYVLSDVWQNAGWGTIIYLAALSAVDPCLHEAAIVDGASKFQRAVHVDIPTILPTAVILLILRMGQVMSVGFEKAFLMQNPLNLSTSEIIPTFVYKIGLAASLPNYSYATAIGLFNAVINLLLLISVNSAAKRLGDTSLW